MKSTEEKTLREKMVDMHDFFLNKIDHAIVEERYIEASWLIYSCIENRFFRVLSKFKNDCIACKGKCRKSTNELSISTKLSCVKRLCEANITCISNSFTLEQLEEIRVWVKQRNKLMHDLLSLETYNQTDEKFKTSAIEGQKILSNLYESCTKFRKIFYAEEYTFTFPEDAMKKCPCYTQDKEKS